MLQERALVFVASDWLERRATRLERCVRACHRGVDKERERRLSNYRYLCRQFPTALRALTAVVGYASVRHSVPPLSSSSPPFPRRAPFSPFYYQLTIVLLQAIQGALTTLLSTAGTAPLMASIGACS